MRETILDTLKNALNQATDDFLTKTLNANASNDIYELGESFARTVQNLKSSIRLASDVISLHLNTTLFLDYHLGGVRGFFPWCKENQLKSKIKVVLSEERFSIFALAKASLAEKDQLISESRALIEELRKNLNGKGKEPEEFETKTIFPEQKNYHQEQQEREIQKFIQKNIELENKLQRLQRIVEQQEAEKSELENKYQDALKQIADQDKQIEDLQAGQATNAQHPKPKPHQRLTRGVFGMGSN